MARVENAAEARIERVEAPVEAQAPESVAYQPIADLRKDLDKLEDKIADKIDKLNFGILAFVWLFIAGGSSAPSIKIAASNGPLYGIAVLCIASLVLGFSQNIMSRRVLERAHAAAEADNQDKVSFDPGSWEIRALYGLRFCKVVATTISALWLCVLLFLAAH